MDQMMEDELTIFQQMMDNNVIIQQGITQNASAIMNGEIYSILMVFAVLHLGEGEGVESNISSAQVLQNLEDLNADFRDGGGE